LALDAIPLFCEKGAMKQLTCLTIACASLALAFTAFGGPEPSGKEMKQVAPPPPPECYDWSGFYIGAYGGYKKAVVDTDLDATGDWDFFPINQGTIHDHAASNLDTDGGEIGGVIGWNFQSGCWVFGIEGTGGYMFLRDSFDSGTFFMDPSSHAEIAATDKSIQQAFRQTWLATAGGRIGYSIGNWLPYVTGGAAFGDVTYEARLHNVSPDGPFLSGDRKDDTNVGWFVGGGMQYAFGAHWAIRAQYEFIDLGSVSFDSPGSPGRVPPSPVFDEFFFSTHNRAEVREHNVSLALMFKF